MPLVARERPRRLLQLRKFVEVPRCHHHCSGAHRSRASLSATLAKPRHPLGKRSDNNVRTHHLAEKMKAAIVMITAATMTSATVPPTMRRRAAVFLFARTRPAAPIAKTITQPE